MNQLEVGKELSRTFLKEEIQMAKTHEKMLTISSHKEMHIKTTLRFHFTPIRIAIIKNTTNMCWRRCGEKEPWSTAGGNASWCNHSGKKFGGFLKF
jgi:hypothetical protein